MFSVFLFHNIWFFVCPPLVSNRVLNTYGKYFLYASLSSFHFNSSNKTEFTPFSLQKSDDDDDDDDNNNNRNLKESKTYRNSTVGNTFVFLRSWSTVTEILQFLLSICIK